MLNGEAQIWLEFYLAADVYLAFLRAELHDKKYGVHIYRL